MIQNLLKQSRVLLHLVRKYKERTNLKRAAVQTPHGFWISGNQEMESGVFEPIETAFVAERLTQADVLVNIGANIGYYGLLAASKGLPVIAVEPNHVNLALLMSNIRANGFESNIEVFPFALSASPGILKLFGSGTGASLIPGWAGSLTSRFDWVPVQTADNLLSGRFPDKRLFIIMDVEGAEMGVLNGALSLLTREPKPEWMIEITIDKHQPDGSSSNPQFKFLFERFFEQGYTAWTVSESPRIVTKEEVARIHETGDNSTGVHNFLFSTRYYHSSN